MKVIATTGAPAAVGPYSQAIQAGEYVFLSGQIPLVPETGLLASEDIKAQTEQVMKNVRAVCEAAGGSLSKIVKCTVFMTDLSQFQAMNEVYAAHFGEHKPARSTVQVAALPRGASVEIEAVMYLK
ncbi:RidA family protein [Turneriella parva]|uniref:Endoribonuclease L-PSP n=1 Tax=Turneriella parva (strain ATCC BAA-1111 / DSM 21527 / NCTC 11395 / H) TaxID=869212 RepID=I4B1C0_TURPD|nr:RidA family protein [Turneriella parva]AFM11077.1 endoribonuclease L-PSP [Turneriella parva DSM 21527]